jgi:polyamine oxidase
MGQEAGLKIAGEIRKNSLNIGSSCGDDLRFKMLHGTMEIEEYDASNGMSVSSFYTTGGQWCEDRW